jgi:regulator of sigma E protease
VLENSAAAEAGLRPGEIIVAVNGTPVTEWGAFQTFVAQSAGHPLNLTLSQNGEARTIAVTPRIQERLRADGVTERVPQLGVGLDPLDNERIVEGVNPLQAVGIGAQQTWGLVVQTWNYVSGMVTGQNSGRDIAGPLGIFTVSGQVAQSALAAPSDDSHGGPLGLLALSLLGLAAMLSVAVGIVNLLPIPVLDGGHLLFYSVEAIRGGKPLPPVAQEWAFRAGLAVMASLFLFATWNDVTRHLGSQG